jgi:hypothetical protein
MERVGKNHTVNSYKLENLNEESKQAKEYKNKANFKKPVFHNPQEENEEMQEHHQNILEMFLNHNYLMSCYLRIKNYQVFWTGV